MKEQHAPFEPLSDLDRARLAHGIALAAVKLARQNAAAARQEQAAKDNAKRREEEGK